MSSKPTLNVLSVSGSPRKDSSNTQLLEAIHKHFGHNGGVYDGIVKLPMFDPDIDHHPWPESVLRWRSSVNEADAIIISTPTYIYNMPAILKNALEWLASSGEMDRKPVLPITYMPYAPRGEKSMQSLIWSLTALNARIVTQLPLYSEELSIDKEGGLREADSIELLGAAIEILNSKG